MKTELLNEYVYAKMIADIALDFKKQRVVKMVCAGASNEEIDNNPITSDDLKNGLFVVSSG